MTRLIATGVILQCCYANVALDLGGGLSLPNWGADGSKQFPKLGAGVTASWSSTDTCKTDSEQYKFIEEALSGSSVKPVFPPQGECQDYNAVINLLKIVMEQHPRRKDEFQTRLPSTVGVGDADQPRSADVELRRNTFADTSPEAGSILSTLKNIETLTRIPFLITTISCLFTDEQVLTLGEEHPILQYYENDYENVQNGKDGAVRITKPNANMDVVNGTTNSIPHDFFLFRDWVSNHIRNGITPPLADSVHYLAREKTRSQAVLRGLNASAVSVDNQLDSEDGNSVCWPSMSKALGYLVVAYGMSELQDPNETLAVLSIAENHIRSCLDTSTSLFSYIFERTDPLIWVVLSLLFDKMGLHNNDATIVREVMEDGVRKLMRKKRYFKCVHWNAEGAEDDAEVTHNYNEVAVRAMLKDAVSLGQGALDQPVLSTVKQVQTPSGMQTQQHHSMARTPPKMNPIPVNTINGPAVQQSGPAGSAQELQQPAEQQLESVNTQQPTQMQLQQWEAGMSILQIKEGMQENCFTKQGEGIWAAYEDNLRNCLAGRKVIQFFTYQDGRLVPVKKSPGGKFLTTVGETSLSMVSGNSEIIWNVKQEFGRSRLLIYDQQLPNRQNLFVRLSNPADEVVPVLLVEPTSANDQWNRDWLEAYFAAMQGLGYQPLSVNSAADISNVVAQLNQGDPDGSAQGRVKSKPDIAVFWRINQMFRSDTHGYSSKPSAALSRDMYAFTKEIETTTINSARVSVFPEPDTALLYQNKLAVLEAFVQNGIPTPTFRVVQRQYVESYLSQRQDPENIFDNLDAWPIFPVLLKHAFAASSRGLAQCDGYRDIVFCLADWFEKHKGQDIVIVQEKLHFKKELRITFLGGQILHGYWRIKESSTDLAASSHISNAVFSFEEIPYKKLEAIIWKISTMITEIGAVDLVLSSDNQIDNQIFVFEVSPIFDMNPSPGPQHKALPYADYKKTQEYQTRRVDGYKTFCRQHIKHSLAKMEMRKITLYVDIDNTLNYAYKRFQNGMSNPLDPALVLQDPVVQTAAAALHKLKETGYRIVYLTARAFPSAAEVTDGWLFEANKFPRAAVILVNSAAEKISYLADNVVAEDLLDAELLDVAPIEQERYFWELPTDRNSLQNIQEARGRATNMILGAGSSGDQATRVRKGLLIDDLTRAHHKQVFEPQIRLKNLLEKYRVPYIKFDIHNADDHWARILQLLVG